MGIFEKIEPETIQPEEPAEEPKSSRTFTGRTLTVAYQPGKKAVVLFSCLCAVPLFQAFLEDGFFVFQVLAAATVVVGAWYLADCLLTLDITFSPAKIVKRGVMGQTVIPTDALLLTVNEQTLRFTHATEKNSRESVKIRRFLIPTEASADILNYAGEVYQVNANAKVKINPAEGASRTSKLAIVEFDKSAASYRIMAAFFVVYALIALFTAGLSDRFPGLAPTLPAYPFRLAGIGLAMAAFFLLRRLSGPAAAAGMPVMERLQRADRRAFRSAVTACAVAGLGLVLFLLFGNMLDFYLFLVVGILCFRDYYPRLSTWAEAAQGATAAAAGDGERALLPRRSLQVSLVLMGAFAVLSYGENRHYLYTSRQDCLDDWGDGKDCQEAPGGSSYYRTVRYYGPRYGSRVGRPTRAVGVGTISRGGFGSMGSFHASFGG